MQNWCFAPYELPQNATEPSIYDFMVQPWNDPETGRKSCSNVRSKPWEFLIYYLMSSRSIPRHSVHSFRGRLKAWLIAFSFDRFSAPPDPVIFFAENLPIGCSTTYKAAWVLRTIWIALECHQTTHLWFSSAATEWPRNSRKSCSNARSKPWEFLIYYATYPQSIPRHPVHGSPGRLKAWLIAFNFDRFSAPPDSVIFFVENLPMRCGTTYNTSWVLRTIWIAQECHQITNLWFCGAAKEWPRNGRKSCYNARSKAWEFLIYYPNSPRAIPRHQCTGPVGV